MLSVLNIVLDILALQIRRKMNPRKNTAGIAGLLYLIVILCGTLYLQYIPSRFKIKGDCAKLMVVFAIVQVPVAFINLLSKFAVLSLLSGSVYVKTLTIDQLYNQILFYLHLYHQGNFINQIFWGLWLFPFGYLVFKSGFLPKIPGVLLMIGCISYLIDFSGTFLFPEYDKTLISNYITLPASIGEIGISLWLIIAGIKDRQIQ